MRAQLEAATNSAGGSKDIEGLKEKLEQAERALHLQNEKDKSLLTSENISHDGFEKTVINKGSDEKKPGPETPVVRDSAPRHPSLLCLVPTKRCNY